MRLHPGNVVSLRTIASFFLTLTSVLAADVVTKLEKFPPGENVLWRDPGDVSALDLALGTGGEALVPKPPFHFVREDLSGSRAKVFVRDAAGRLWNIKFGEEAHADTFASRIAWACGYVAQPMYLIPNGKVEGVGPLKRAYSAVAQDGTFVNGRFQLRGDNPKFLKQAGWSWVNNPYRGSHEIQGLKIIMMMLSDWDDKDARDEQRDSNLAIFQETGSERPKYLYFVSDWGGSMGRWGGVRTRTKWDAKGFAAQTPDFVTGVHNGMVGFGYIGTRTADLAHGIRVSDVQWLMQYLGRLSDEQIRRGLAASGAKPAEMEAFASSLRRRIQQLQQAAGPVPPGGVEPAPSAVAPPAGSLPAAPAAPPAAPEKEPAHPQPPPQQPGPPLFPVPIPPLG